jgi:DNA polymerase bacteriophage-type
MTPDAIKVLRLRQQASKSSTAKLDALAEQVSPDGRLRYCYTFMGAARTGRWAGSGPQPHNFPRKPVKIGGLEVDLRAAFRAPKGKKLVVCDLGAIENRVLGWISGCDAILKVFRDKRDPYIDFATRLYHVPYEQVTKEQRQMAKPAVLGCGYGLGAGEDKVDKNGDSYRSGLWGYAAAMGIEMSQAEAAQAVKVFRSAYPEVQSFWRAIENAVVTALINPGKGVPCGQLLVGSNDDRMVIVLPSKRRLHYLRPLLQKGEWSDGSPKMDITFEGLNGTTKQWCRERTYGSRLTENVVQAISRDVLAHGLIAADAAGFEIVGHCHDEIISLAPARGLLGLEELRNCMVTQPDWAKDLPLAADGYDNAEVYTK